MKTARYGHSCTVHDNQILAIGGWDGTTHRLVDKFNPSTNRWTVLTSLPFDMHNGQAGTLSNSIVFVMDRDDNNIYTTNDLTTWNKTVINFNSGLLPAPLVPSTLINCWAFHYFCLCVGFLIFYFVSFKLNSNSNFKLRVFKIHLSNSSLHFFYLNILSVWSRRVNFRFFFFLLLTRNFFSFSYQYPNSTTQKH